MDGLDDRRRASEDRYIREEERRSRLRRRRDRHLANAVAARLGMGPAEAEAHADAVVAWRPPSPAARDESLVAKLAADLAAGGVAVSADEVRNMLREATAAAERDEAAG